MHPEPSNFSLWNPWWSWNSATATLGDYVYRWFNLFEAGAWFVFAACVVLRWRTHHHSAWEPVYAAAFLLFGLTDLLEAWQQSLPLLILKGGILFALLTLRATIRRRWYPESKLF